MRFSEALLTFASEDDKLHRPPVSVSLSHEGGFLCLRRVRLSPGTFSAKPSLSSLDSPKSRLFPACTYPRWKRTPPFVPYLLPPPSFFRPPQKLGPSSCVPGAAKSPRWGFFRDLTRRPLSLLRSLDPLLFVGQGVEGFRPVLMRMALSSPFSPLLHFLLFHSSIPNVPSHHCA